MTSIPGMEMSTHMLGRDKLVAADLTFLFLVVSPEHSETSVTTRWMCLISHLFLLLLLLLCLVAARSWSETTFRFFKVQFPSLVPNTKDVQFSEALLSLARRFIVFSWH